MKGLLLSFFVFSSVLVTAYGLKCYVCTGTEDVCEKGKMEGNKKFEMDCPKNGKCMRLWAKKDGATAVVNSCSSDALCKATKDTCDKSDDGDCAVGCCDTDLCNAGSSASFSVFLMTVCSVLGLALLK